MSTIRYNSRHNAGHPLFFDDFQTRDTYRLQKSLQALHLMPVPATNIFETAEAVVIELAAPGLSEFNIQVRMHERGLEVIHEQEGEQFEPMDMRRIWRFEHRLPSFRRNFELNPEILALEALQISSENGVIRFEIPKREQHRRLVAVNRPFSMN